MRTAATCLALLLANSCTSTGDKDATSNTARGSTPTSSTLSLDRLLSGPSLTGSPPSAPSWSPDSSRLAFRWSGPNGGRREIWLVEANGSGLRQLTNDSRVRAMAWLPSGDSLLFTRSSELWRTDLTGQASRIADLGDGASDLAVAPDSRHASYRRSGDLWLVDLQSGATRQLTNFGQPSISKVPIGRYRRPDVEIGPYVWGGPTYAWAPNGRSIAVHYVDRREVRKVPFPHYLGDETDPNLVRRSYPGDANEARKVGVLDVATGALKVLALPEASSTRVVDFSWSKHGRLLIDCESDTAVDRWLHVLEPGAAKPRLLWHDRRETRVYTSCGSAWHPDGEHVVVLSDLADRYGLYALHLDRPEPRLLTDPAFDVTSGPTIAADGGIFYASAQPSPYERHVCRTTLTDKPLQLTSKPGESRPYPSPNGAQLALLHSNDTTPPELFLGAGRGAATQRRVTNSTPTGRATHPWVKPRYLTFPSHIDGATLHARILEPAGLDRSQRHPVIFGPVYSNTVRNRWGGFYGMFQQLLVARGYLVVQVDVRGSTGYGRAFREAFLADFAGRDLDDLESAVRHLETLSYVDPGAIGIWGSSYGGTLTAYALLKKPGLFDAGVACAAAVDPYFFGGDDVAIVRHPKSRPDAFTRGAAQYAANLEDPLLLIHGMQDQIVPFKTVVDLAEALMRAGKDFDFAFAPAGTHGWTSPPHYARHLLGKLMAHFDRHLRDDDR